jgi:ERCC4-related helicase
MESHERKGAIPAIDNHASRTWHFPTNLARRQYQYDIIQQALCQNSLIALPTGLGKTFIAAVIMYNYYRWFPSGRIIFMAPTRPLVTQQLEATLKNVEIDARQTVEMTGGQSPTQREQLWRDQRVFFLTPQVLQNDLTSGICDARQLVLLVFDEAHRALGNHAYCDVVRLLTEMTDSWRVRILALTATPASNVETVQQIIDNLLLSKIIIRSDESPDVKPYVHGKTIETVVVPESADINFIRTQFESHIVKPYLDKLVHLGVFNIADPAKLGSFQLLSARDSFRKTKVSSKSVLGAVEGLFAILISLYHSYDLLILHGITAFKTHLMRLPESTMHQTRLRHELDANPFFVQLLAHIESKMQLPFFVSHPKIDIVEHKLLQHFTDATGPTRAIVFSQYRESVYEIVSKLNRHAPTLKVMAFVGQSGSNGERQQITQRQQIDVSRTSFTDHCRYWKNLKLVDTTS